MSAEKCGGILTPEMIETATNKAAKTGGHIPDRIISVRADRILKKIHHKAPNWDSWTIEAEIWWKARSMGITEEE